MNNTFRHCITTLMNLVKNAVWFAFAKQVYVLESGVSCADGGCGDCNCGGCGCE